MHCAGACPKQAIRFSELTEAETYPALPEDPLDRLIRQRRSIRNYADKLPPKELIQNALDTAAYAPSGKNQRAFRFTVVWGKEQVQLLRDRCLSLCEEYGEAPELPKLMKHGTDLLTCGAPCMIVAWSPDDCLNPILDPAVFMAQLELILVHAGLGTCWGGYLRQVSDRFPEIRQLLGIPEGAHVRCALMVGYAKGEKYHSVWRPKTEALWLEGGETL
jgi:nitroreductase